MRVASRPSRAADAAGATVPARQGKPRIVISIGASGQPGAGLAGSRYNSPMTNLADPRSRELSPTSPPTCRAWVPLRARPRGHWRARTRPREERRAGRDRDRDPRATRRGSSRPMPRTSPRRRRAAHDAAFVDRLTLTPKAVEAMAEGLEQIAALPDPGRRDHRSPLPPVRHPGRPDARAARRGRHHLRVAART